MAEIEQIHDTSTLIRLVQQAQAGDTHAFSYLVVRFQDMAVGYAYSFLGDWGLAEDAAQEAFLNAYLALSQLREPAAFPGWLRRIVFKQGDRLVRGRQEQFVPLDAVETLSDPAADLVEQIVRAEAQWQVHQAVAALPLHEREVVTLFYIGQQSHKEIAAFLELSIGAVKSRLFSARQRLKASMLTMIEETLPIQRPSQNSTFTDQVMTLFKATTAGDTETVRRLLTSDPNLAHASALAQSPLWSAEAPALHLAVMYGRKDIIDLLLKHGADINEADEKHKFTPLHHALDLADFLPHYAALEMPTFLETRGAKQDIVAALWRRNTTALQQLLTADPAVANAIGPGNLPPLCHAPTPDLADVLLRHGADPFFTMEGKRWLCRTPLRYAKAEMLRYLLVYTHLPLDPFFLCRLDETEQLLALLEADPTLAHARSADDHPLGAGVQLLHIAAVQGNIRVAQRLLLLDANVNARLPAADDMTPLHLAIVSGRKEVLTTASADLGAMQQSGVLRLLPEMAQLLINAGADLTACDREQAWTPLQWAEANLEDETDRGEVIILLRTAMHAA